MTTFTYVKDQGEGIDVDLGRCWCSVRVHASEPSKGQVSESRSTSSGTTEPATPSTRAAARKS
jgi:hypothetical protein